MEKDSEQILGGVRRGVNQELMVVLVTESPEFLITTSKSVTRNSSKCFQCIWFRS